MAIFWFFDVVGVVADIWSMLVDGFEYVTLGVYM